MVRSACADVSPTVTIGSIESGDGGTRSSPSGLVLATICGLVLSGILVAGLWPFHAPQNDVSWSNPGNGLIFGKHGSIVSAGAFGKNGTQSEGACSVEIWLKPGRAGSSGTILAFYLPATRVTPFALRQWRDGLVLERRSPDQSRKKAAIYVSDVFNRLNPVVVAIHSGERGTAIYVDGLLVKKDRNFRLSSQNLTGQLIVGNAPLTRNSWNGWVRGLAVYDRELTSGEVSQHFMDWTGSKQAHQAATEGPIARYLFDEGNGRVVRNQVDSATNLVIPERFFVLGQQLLERPWDEVRPEWNYWKDVAVNIGGFIPLGFFFRAYFQAIRKVRQAAWLTIALGFVVSFTIEVLQSFLPTRDSGMTDLITNTFGTVLGAILCAWSMKHGWFVRARIANS